MATIARVYASDPGAQGLTDGQRTGLQGIISSPLSVPAWFGNGVLVERAEAAAA
ncbi:hypothetical protein [Kitasatospora griseola]|uniref:hypothetical protein n=1 Tax=Kitasatospora griseola TaxID=2064 RepID=UPI0034209A5D